MISGGFGVTNRASIVFQNSVHIQVSFSIRPQRVVMSVEQQGGTGGEAGRHGGGVLGIELDEASGFRLSAFGFRGSASGSTVIVGHGWKGKIPDWLERRESENLPAGNFFGFIFGWKRHREAPGKSVQIVGLAGLRGIGVVGMRAKKFSTGDQCSFNR